MAEKVEIKIVVDKQTGAIKVAGEELKGLGEQAKNTESSLGALGGTFASLVSIGAVVSFFKSAIQASIEQEDAVNKLNNALASQGNFTAAASRGLQEYANQLQATTAFSDDAVINAQAMLATFGLNEAQIKKTTQAAADLATVMGTDLKQAAILLGRAYQGNTEMLNRVGIQVSTTIPVAEQFDAVLAQISNRMGGRAQADAKTFSGSLTQLKNAFGDLTEEIGDQLIPTIQNFADTARENLDSVRNFFAGVLFTLRSLAAGAEASFQIIKTGAITLGQALGTQAGIIALAFQGKFKEAAQAFKDFQQQAIQNGRDLVTELSKSNKKIEDAWDQTIGARLRGETLARERVREIRNQEQSEFIELSDKEKKQLEEDAKFKTSLIEKQLANDLAMRNVSSQRRLELINKAQFEEEAIQVALLDRRAITQEEFEQRMASSHEQFTARRREIEQKYTEDVVAANEQWFAQATNLYARFNALARSTVDNFTKGIGDAFAQQIVYSKDFAQAFTQLWNNIKVQVISAITQMIAKLIALRIAQAAVGFGTGGLGGGLVGKLFAAGGRVPGLKRIRKLANGGRTSGPELAVIGEGRDDESIVPDGQARGFAMGVLAGSRGKPAAAPAAAQAPAAEPAKMVNATINITINSMDLGDPAVTRRLARDLADMVINETEEGIRLSRRIGDVNERFQGRSV